MIPLEQQLLKSEWFFGVLFGNCRGSRGGGVEESATMGNRGSKWSKKEEGDWA
jgi:hypothetical protein